MNQLDHKEKYRVEVDINPLSWNLYMNTLRSSNIERRYDVYDIYYVAYTDFLRKKYEQQTLLW